MKVEVLISTMNKECHSFIKGMQIKGDCTIINQCDEDNFACIQENESNIQFISYKEKGLSISRNRAIENAKGDICIIADDSCVYEDNYMEIVTQSYQKYPKADVIIFDVKIEDSNRRSSTIGNKNKKIGYLKSLKVSSVRISFKTSSIKKHKLKFNTNFGSGSGLFISGEENIFLFDCLKEKLKIIHVPILISKIKKHESTWFKGYNSDYFKTKGAISFALFKHFYFLYLLQFAIRKYKLYNNECSFTKAISYMIKGKSMYKNTSNIN